MLLIPNPFVEPGEGLYGSRQESLIEIVGTAAKVVSVFAPHPVIKTIAGGVSFATTAALFIDNEMEKDYRMSTFRSDLYSSYPGGVVYYY